MANKTKRYEIIDICKAMAITVVVWMHFGMPGSLSRFVHLFILPVFYFVSGLFFRPEKYLSTLSFLKKKAKSLLIPYFSMGTLIYIIWTVVYVLFLPDKVTPPLEYAKYFLWHNTQPVAGIWGGIQWYVTSIFFVELLVFLVNKLIRNKWLLLLFFTVLGITVILVANSLAAFWLPMAFDTALIVSVFYCVGYLVSDKIMGWIEKVKTIWLISISFLAFVGTLLLCILNESTNVRMIRFGNPFYYYAGALLGVIMVICLATLVERTIRKRERLLQWICYIGSSTIIILYLHRQFDGINKTLLEAVFQIKLTGAMGYLYYGISLVVFFAIASPLCRWIDKHVGFLFGRFQVPAKK